MSARSILGQTRSVLTHSVLNRPAANIGRTCAKIDEQQIHFSILDRVRKSKNNYLSEVNDLLPQTAKILDLSPPLRAQENFYLLIMYVLCMSERGLQ